MSLPLPHGMRAALLVATLVTWGAADAESVQLVREHGIFLVPVLLNNSITLKFTIDSGASDVSVPEDVVSTLIRTGSMSKADFLASQAYQLADGSTQTERRFRIRSLRIGTLELNDVVASVAPMAGPLLLGQSFLTKLSSWTIDNKRGVLIFNETASKSVSSSQPPKSENDGGMADKDEIDRRVTRALDVVLAVFPPAHWKSIDKDNCGGIGNLLCNDLLVDTSTITTQGNITSAWVGNARYSISLWKEDAYWSGTAIKDHIRINCSARTIVH